MEIDASGEPATVALVTRVSRRLRELALRASQDDGASLPIGPAELAVLETLARARDPLGVTAIARATGMAQSWISKLVGDFAAAGVVTRSTNPLDRRQTLVRLSDEVHARVFGDSAQRLVDAGFAAVVPRLSAADRERVKVLVVELDRLLG